MEKFKRAFSERVRTWLHDVLFLICMGLSTGLFVQFGNSILSKAIFALLAIGFESTKLWDLLKFKQKIDSKQLSRSFFFGVSYLAKATLSIVASLGFALVMLEAQTNLAEVQIDTGQVYMESFETRIDQLDGDISRETDAMNAKVIKLSELDPTWVTASERFSEQIDEHRDNLDRYKTERENVVQEKLGYIEGLTSSDAIANPSSMFEIMAGKLDSGATSQDIMFWIMLSMVFLLELSVAVTSGHLKDDEPVKVVIDNTSIKKEYFDFIDGLTNGVEQPGMRLNSLSKIVENKNIDHGRAWHIRTHMLSVRFKGLPILESSRGGTRSRYSPENLKKIMNYELNKVKEI